MKEETASLRAGLHTLSGTVRDVRDLVEKPAGSTMELEQRYSELNRRLSHLEVTMGGLAEALLSQMLLEELRSRGYRVRKRASYRVNDEKT